MSLRAPIIFCTLTLALTACANTKNKAEDPPSVEANATTYRDPGALVREYAKWMPSDTFGVAVVDIRSAYSFSTIGLKSPDPEVQARLDAVKDAFTEEMRSLLLERFGTAMGDAHTLVLTVGEEGPRVLLLGLAPPEGGTETLGGVEAHPLFPRHPNDDPEPGSASVWALPIEGGLALFEDAQELVEAATSSTSLASTPARLDALAELVGRDGAGMVLGALVDGELRETLAAQFPVELPRQVYMSLGAQAEVRVFGSEETLSFVQNMVQDGLNAAEVEVKRNFPPRATASTEDAIAGTIARYVFDMARAGLQTTREDGRLIYTFPLGFDGGDAQLTAFTPLVLGISSAIAIPAFLRAVKKSKVSEAELTMRKLADGAKAYFTSEQRYDVPGGAQPWHVASTGARGSGYPVPWAEYVFPGGVSFSFTSSSDIPTGGSKIVPSPIVLEGMPELLDPTLGALGVAFEDPLYFRYTYTTLVGSQVDAVVVITAEADFDPTTPEMHTITQRIYVDMDSQEVIIAPPYTLNEFE